MVPVRLVLPLLALAGAACPSGEVLPHPPCGSGEHLSGQGAGQRCVAGDAGSPSDAGPDADAGDDRDASPDAATDGGGSCGECLAPSVCDRGQCVRCVPTDGTDDPGCEGAEPVCVSDPEPRCVACAADADCADPAAARCVDDACVPCAGADECAHLAPLRLCDDGACVECTVASEAADCGADSCDPATRRCTDTARGSRLACETCRSDSECAADHHCMPMDFAGAAREAHYCLPDRDGACGHVYASSRSGTSASGADATVCSPLQTLTTCEAVLDMLASQACADAGDCGDPALADDGACDGTFCTIACGTDGECPLGQSCGASNTCER